MPQIEQLCIPAVPSSIANDSGVSGMPSSWFLQGCGWVLPASVTAVTVLVLRVFGRQAAKERLDVPHASDSLPSQKCSVRSYPGGRRLVSAEGFGKKI